MSARETPKKTGEAANRGMSGVTSLHLGFYTVGLRISQLLLLHDIAESVTAQHGALVSEDIMIRQAYSLLATAFERLARSLGLSREITQRGHEIIAQGSNSWKACTKADADNLGDTVLCMAELESLVRDMSASLGSARPEARAWFELGLIVPVGEGDASLPYEQRTWSWYDPERLDRHLKSTGMRRDQIFPELVDPKSVDGWILLPGRFFGWNNIEAGLMKLAEMVDPEGAAAEEDRLQLTVPEIAKYLFGSKIYEAGRKSSERLVRKWIQEGRIPARRTKRGLYTIRTSHLEILKDVHR